MDNISINVSEHPRNKGITLLAVKGYIDSTTAPEFERQFISVLRDNKFKLVIDLKDVDYIGSAGWGIFVSELKKIRGAKGDLLLSGMCPEVQEVFELLDFNAILKYFPDVESAVLKGFKRV